MLLHYNDFLLDLLIDGVVTYIFVFLIYYRRHGDRDMAITLGLFNVFLFTIVITMTMIEINLAAGFTLFAVLSIITLRSVNIEKIEVGYLFGVIALALINGISFSDYTLLAMCNMAILLAAFILDSAWLIKPTMKVELTLEQVALEEIADKNRLLARVQERYDLPIQHMRMQKYNAEKNTLRISVHFRIT